MSAVEPFSNLLIHVDKHNHIVEQTVICICLTIAITSSFIFNSYLVKEPVTQNPFKLIYTVIRYAIKHKHPQCRSAFTYCEDELPSRIDFGKSKYGGPFTTEQVEDVKTFLRLVVFLALASVLVSDILLIHRPIEQLIHVLTQSSTSIPECYKDRFLTSTIGFCTAAIAIPLHEFIFYPIIRKRAREIKNLPKVYIRCNNTNSERYYSHSIRHNGKEELR